MSSVRKHKHCQKWYKPSEAAAISLQRLWCASRASVETRGKKTQKPIILRAYQERISLRGLSRVFDVHRQSISRWIVEHVKSLPKLKDTLLPAKPEDILEYDEAWSFVLKKINKRWLWTVMCRRTRQIIAFVIGDRSEKTCRRLWRKVPIEYRSCVSYSDFWDAYQKVLPQETHHAVGKDSGQVSHMERWYCTLRQHQARYVRKTLSFSKRDTFHHLVTKWFIVDYNLARKQFTSLTL
jgi:insertion element IS1 protein InsB